MEKIMKGNYMTKYGLVVSAFAMLALAANYSPAKAAEGFEPAHKVVIQVDSADVKEQQLALNNAANLLKHYGPDNIKIEMVAYGPGLKMLTDKSESKERIRSLSQQDIQFSACANTMQEIGRAHV